MGETSVDATVRGPTGEANVTLIVDSGAIYTCLPIDVWRRIGIEPTRMQEFSLGDGSAMIRAVGNCQISLPFGDTHTTVILGEPGDAPLLGVVTLEELGLKLNPIKRTLEPMRMRL